MSEVINWELYSTIVGIAGVVYVLFLIGIVKGSPAGDEKMNKIASAIKEGAIAYLNRQLKTVAIAAVVIVVIIGATMGITTAVGFIIGKSIVVIQKSCSCQKQLNRFGGQ